MGVFDKAKDLADQHPDQANAAVDKAGDLFDEKTGGDHAEHTDKVQDFAKEKLAGGNAQQEDQAQPGA